MKDVGYKKGCSSLRDVRHFQVCDAYVLEKVVLLREGCSLMNAFCSTHRWMFFLYATDVLLLIKNVLCA